MLAESILPSRARNQSLEEFLPGVHFNHSDPIDDFSHYAASLVCSCRYPLNRLRCLSANNH